MTANLIHRRRLRSLDPEAAAQESAAPARTVAGEPRRRFLVICLGFLVLASTLVLISTARGHGMSIVDEAPHADYTYRIAHGGIPSEGSLLSLTIREEAYCHEQQGRGLPCTDFDPGYQANAQDYVFGDPPVYYAITGYLTDAVSALIPGPVDFITVARNIGILWLTAAMIVFYLALRKFRLDWRYATAGALMLPLLPGVLAACSQVTSDAVAPLSGAAALYVFGRILNDRNTGRLLPVAVTLFTSGSKTLNGLPMLIVGCMLCCMAVAALRRGERALAVRRTVVAAAVFVSFAALYLTWMYYQAHRGVPNWVNPNVGNGKPLLGSPLGDYLSNTFGVFGRLTTNFWLQPQINGETVVMWATGIGVVLAAAPLLVMTAQRSRSDGWTIGLATFLGITSVTFVVQAQTYTANNEVFASVPPRYALSFLPWTVACLAIVAARRRMARTTVIVTCIGFAVILLAITGTFQLGPALTSTGTTLVG